MDPKTSYLYNKTLRFLSFRPRSVYEVKTYLQKNQASQDQINQIIKKLSNLNFLNDLDFAQKWVEDRKKSHPRSLSVLQLELRQKGIPEEIIKKVISVEKANNSDLFMAKNLIKKILSRLTISSESFQEIENLKRKLVSRLQMKGFSYETIKTAIDESFKKE